MKATAAWVFVVLAGSVLAGTHAASQERASVIRLGRYSEVLATIARVHGDSGKQFEASGNYTAALDEYQSAIKTLDGYSGNSVSVELAAASARVDAARALSYLIEHGHYTNGAARILGSGTRDTYLREAETRFAKAAQLAGTSGAAASAPNDVLASTIHFNAAYGKLMQGKIGDARDALRQVGNTSPQAQSARQAIARIDKAAAERRKQKQREALTKLGTEIVKTIIPHYSLLEAAANVYTAFTQ